MTTDDLNKKALGMPLALQWMNFPIMKMGR